MDNETIELINNRKSIRVFEQKEIEKEIKNKILDATLRAPSAGNMMMYSIIEVEDDNIKKKLVDTCDNQAFIAKSPWILVYIADYSRWLNFFETYDCKNIEKNKDILLPKEADLIMAINDAMIAAQTTVIAAESFGIGSCYIGDIIENFEIHREIFNLPKYTYPITMLCLGYPTQAQKQRKQTIRYDKKHIVFKNKYEMRTKEDFEDMYSNEHYKSIKYLKNAENFAQHMYIKKYISDFTKEMRRSIKEALKDWK